MSRVKHKWNSRPCVEFARYPSERAALNTAHYFIFRWRPLPRNLVAVLCPICAPTHGGAWHLMQDPDRYGVSALDQLAALPSFVEPYQANTMQHGPNNRA